MSTIFTVRHLLPQRSRFVIPDLMSLTVPFAGCHCHPEESFPKKSMRDVPAALIGTGADSDSSEAAGYTSSPSIVPLTAGFFSPLRKTVYVSANMLG